MMSVRLRSSVSAIRLNVWLIDSNSGAPSEGSRACNSPRSMRLSPSRMVRTGRRDRPTRKNTSRFTATRKASTSAVRLFRSSHASSTDREESTVTVMFPSATGMLIAGMSGRTRRTNQSGAERPTL